MLAIVGDLHGNVKSMQNIDDCISKEKDISAVIQVGDWGWYPNRFPMYERLKMNNKWYFIDGNHEHHWWLSRYVEVSEVLPNVHFIPRGTVLELDGKKIAFMGGAGSVDKAYNSNWSDGEDILDEEIALLDDVTSVDLLITHCPPQSTIQKYFDVNDLRLFGLPNTWMDINADKIETLWKRLGEPPLVCGHMHRRVIDGTVRILDIEEIYYI